MLERNTKIMQNSRDCAQIHNVNFYNLNPRGVQCMAKCDIEDKLALARDDDSIEIWDVQHVPVLEKVIQTRSAVQQRHSGHLWECLVWAGSHRLFSVGMHEFVVEWDLTTLQLKQNANLTGNAIWCAATNKANTELAVGTEEGYINILNIADNELQYTKLFDKQNGRVICCCYDDSGKYLVTGSINTIRIWEVATGHALHKMNIAQASRNKDTIVWCLQVLHDFSIVAGDSRGQLTVWNGNNGSQVESHQVLAADILSLTLVDNQQQLVCSGIEPIIRIYSRTKVRREDVFVERWVKSLQRNVHDHDVRSLICDRDRIFSAGVDGYLGLSYVSRAKPQIHKYAPLYQGLCVSVAAECKHMLLRYGNYVEVWRLGAEDKEEHNEIQGMTNGTQGKKKKQKKMANGQAQRRDVPLGSIPEKLLTMRTKKGMAMSSAALSNDGNWLCYATSLDLRLFHVKSSPLQVERVTLQQEYANILHVEFSTDNRLLFAMNDLLHQVLVFQLATGSVEQVDCIDLKTELTTRPKLFRLSTCGMYFVIADDAHTITVWRKEHAHFHHYLTLPRYSAAVTTALNLQCIGDEKIPRVLACFADGKFFEYHLEDRSLVFSANTNDMLPTISAYAVTHVYIDESRPNYVFFQTGQELLIAKKLEKPANNSNEENSAGKRTKHEAGQKPCTQVLKLTYRNNYEHLVQFVKLNAMEYATVRVNPLSLMEKLTRAFKQKKFGVS